MGAGTSSKVMLETGDVREQLFLRFIAPGSPAVKRPRRGVLKENFGEGDSLLGEELTSRRGPAGGKRSGEGVELRFSWSSLLRMR